VDLLSITGTNLEVSLNRSAYDDSLINFSETPLDIHGFRVELPKMDLPTAAISGSFHLQAFDFIDLSVDLAITQNFITVDLDDGSLADVAMLTFAETDLDFFAGANGVGFALQDADFGFAVSVDLLNSDPLLGTLPRPTPAWLALPGWIP